MHKLATLVTIAAMAAVATSAVAQTTVCTNAGSSVVCRQRSEGQGYGILGAISAKKQSDLRKRIGQLIVAGDCEGAVNAALEAGQFGLAKEAKAMCTASPAK